MVPRPRWHGLVVAVPVHVEDVPPQDVVRPERLDELACRLAVDLPHQLVIREVALEFVLAGDAAGAAALAHRLSGPQVPCCVPAPEQKPAGMPQVVERVTRCVHGGLFVLRIARELREGNEDAEEVLLVREVRHDPLARHVPLVRVGGVQLPHGRRMRVGVQPVDEERRRLGAVSVAAVSQCVVGEGADGRNVGIRTFASGLPGASDRRRPRRENHRTDTGRSPDHTVSSCFRAVTPPQGQRATGVGAAGRHPFSLVGCRRLTAACDWRASPCSAAPRASPREAYGPTP
jgi:hypothetical protein